VAVIIGIADYLRRYQPREVTMFADACFSGRVRDGANLIKGAKLLSVEVVPPDVDAAVLTSSGGKEISRVARRGAPGRVQLRADAPGWRARRIATATSGSRSPSCTPGPPSSSPAGQTPADRSAGLHTGLPLIDSGTLK
jgi:hypothetical protein